MNHNFEQITEDTDPLEYFQQIINSTTDDFEPTEITELFIAYLKKQFEIDWEGEKILYSLQEHTYRINPTYILFMANVFKLVAEYGFASIDLFAQMKTDLTSATILIFISLYFLSPIREVNRFYFKTSGFLFPPGVAARTMEGVMQHHYPIDLRRGKFYIYDRGEDRFNQIKQIIIDLSQVILIPQSTTALYKELNSRLSIDPEGFLGVYTEQMKILMPGLDWNDLREQILFDLTQES